MYSHRNSAGRVGTHQVRAKRGQMTGFGVPTILAIHNGGSRSALRATGCPSTCASRPAKPMSIIRWSAALQTQLAATLTSPPGMAGYLGMMAPRHAAAYSGVG